MGAFGAIVIGTIIMAFVIAASRLLEVKAEARSARKKTA